LHGSTSNQPCSAAAGSFQRAMAVRLTGPTCVHSAGMVLGQFRVGRQPCTPRPIRGEAGLSTSTPQPQVVGPRRPCPRSGLPAIAGAHPRRPAGRCRPPSPGRGPWAASLSSHVAAVIRKSARSPGSLPKPPNVALLQPVLAVEPSPRRSTTNARVHRGRPGGTHSMKAVRPVPFRPHVGAPGTASAARSAASRQRRPADDLLDGWAGVAVRFHAHGTSRRQLQATVQPEKCSTFSSVDGLHETSPHLPEERPGRMLMRPGRGWSERA